MSDITPDPAVPPVRPRVPVAAGAAVELPPELNPRGYTKPAKPPRRRRSRLLAWLAVSTSCLVLIVSGTLYAGYRKLDSNIKRIDIPVLGSVGGDKGDDKAPAAGDAEPGTPARPVKPKGAEKDLNFLIIGSDSREGATKAELKAFGTEYEGGQRSDTMLLVNVPANREGAYVLSFPRDLYVDIPGEDGKHKINTAFSKGGADLAIRTVESLTQIQIDHYLEVNFAAFLRMVDALEGVEMCIPKAMRSRDAALNLKAGKQKLNGRTALSYVRARNFDRDSEYKDQSADVGRIARQQQFLGAMIRRATSSSTLLRPDRLVKFLDRATSALKADEGLETDDLQKLALRFRNLDPKRVVFATVPNYDPGRRYGGLSVLLVDDGPAEEIFTAIREGSIREDGTVPPPPSVTTGPKLTVPAADVRVRVLNGTGTDGKAADVREDLQQRGFVVTEIASAPAKDRGFEETVVRHGPSRSADADTLVASIPGSRKEVDESLGRTLTVIVGAGYEGTKKVTVAVPRPSGSAAPKQPTTAADNPCD